MPDNMNPGPEENDESIESAPVDPVTREALRASSAQPFPDVVIESQDRDLPEPGPLDGVIASDPSERATDAERAELAEVLSKLGDTGNRDFTARGPVSIRDFIALYPPERVTDAERAELAEWVKKVADTNNRDFTAPELAEIRDEIRKLHDTVRKLPEMRKSQEAIEKVLKEVQDGSERMGRKDWFMFVLGAATSLVIMEVIPPLVLLPFMLKAFHVLRHLLLDT